MSDTYDNADIGAETLLEPGVVVGYRYHPACGPARIGAHGILRMGTIVYGDVVIGDHFQSGHHAVIRAKVRMGDFCTLANHATIEGIVRFGDGVRVMSNVYIPSRTWIGNDVFIGPGTTLLNDRFPGRHERPATPRGPTIGDDVTIGGGVTVLPGITIGSGSFVAAGAVVIRDVPDRSLVIGPLGEVRPLPQRLDRPNDRELTRQPLDLWHPLSDIAANNWPDDWPESLLDDDVSRSSEPPSQSP